MNDNPLNHFYSLEDDKVINNLHKKMIVIYLGK